MPPDVFFVGRFSPDSRWLVFRWTFESFYGFDLQDWPTTFAPMVNLPHSGSDSIFRPVFSPDSTLAAGCAQDGNVYLWPLQKKSDSQVAPLIKWSGSRGMSSNGEANVAFSPKGTFTVASGGDGRVYASRATERQQPASPSARHDIGTVQFVFGTDEEHLFTYAGDDLYFGRLGDPLDLVLRHSSRIQALAVCNNHHDLVVFGENDAAILKRQFFLLGIPITTLEWPELAQMSD